MTHTYTVTGMTCSSCEAKVKSALLQLPHITSAEVSKETSTATLSMDNHISVADLQQALNPKYQISMIGSNDQVELAKNWVQTYKPILLIFAFILGITLLIQLQHHTFHLMQWMSHFMAGFFLVFSFFKFLNLQGFADSYRMYDIVAKKIPAWGYIYPFVELGLGLAILLHIQAFATNLITFVVMSVSLIGVLQSVLNKRKIQCACLGAVFNLPMSTVTIIEDGLMIGMSALMLLNGV